MDKATQDEIKEIFRQIVREEILPEMRKMIRDELYDGEAIRNMVSATLATMGLKSASLAAGRIYRSEMLEHISRREYDHAVRQGRLHPMKNSPKRNSKVYVRRAEWYDYLKKKMNRKL